MGPNFIMCKIVVQGMPLDRTLTIKTWLHTNRQIRMVTRPESGSRYDLHSRASTLPHRSTRHTIYRELSKGFIEQRQHFHTSLSVGYYDQPFLLTEYSSRRQLSNRKRAIPVAKDTMGQSMERLLTSPLSHESEQIGSDQQVEFQLSTTMQKQKKYILVIDDETSVREVTAEILHEANVHTLEAEDGLIGLELFRQHAEQIVLVLLDFSMPGLNGGQVLEQMRKIDPTVPILFFSGFGQHDVVRRFYRSGTVGFLQKPYTINELLLAVRNNRKRE